MKLPRAARPILAGHTVNLRTVGLAVALVSAQSLAYEIVLTRISSVIFTSQNVFLVLGLSLLGISLGAVIDLMQGGRNSRASGLHPGMLLLGSSSLIVGSSVLLVEIGASTGMTSFAALTVFPFISAGYSFSQMFRPNPAQIGRLYAADLVGASAGALSVPFLLPLWGPIQSLLFLGLVGAIAGSLLLIRGSGRTSLSISAAMVLAIGTLFVLNVDDALIGDIPVGNDPNKDLFRLTALERDVVSTVDSRWSTFGRTDLIRFSSDSGLMAIFIDGAAGTNMVRFNGDLNTVPGSGGHAIHEFGGLIPLLRLRENQKDSALIIGPGGGRDVLLALKADIRRITAVEVNPEMVQIVKDYRAFNGGLYTDYDSVNVIVADGRDFLRGSDGKYDVIMLFMPITKSSRSLNAFALSESYLFTKEAFAEYRRHLTDEGTLLFMSHSMMETSKILSSMIAAMQDEGFSVKDVMRRVYILGSDMMPLIGFHKDPLTREESDFFHAIAHSRLFVPGLSYVPDSDQPSPSISTGIDAGFPMMNRPFLELASGGIDLPEFANQSGFNIRPVMDDSPFFLWYDFDLPSVVSRTMSISGGVILVIFLLAGWNREKLGELSGSLFFVPIYTVLIGLGYIIVEISLLQRLIQYLGDPSRSLALLLAALLTGSGIGSFATRRSPHKVAVWAGLIGSIAVLLFYFGMPMVLSSIPFTHQPSRQLISAVMLLLTGIPMGVMFPIGLRVAHDLLGAKAISWSWALNGAASVFGSAFTIATAMTLGYSWSLAMGAIMYIAAAGTMIALLNQGGLPIRGGTLP